jgi:probable HAF family extracellular repeat protein
MRRPSFECRSSMRAGLPRHRVDSPSHHALRQRPVRGGDPRAARIDLGTLGGASSYANDVNAGGTAPSGTADNAQGLRRAFRWTEQDAMTDLGTLPGMIGARRVASTTTARSSA